MSAIHKIGLYGGTFDPVHEGHIHLASLAKEALSLDEIRFLPCQISPHKSGRIPTSGEQRIEMLKIATSDLPWAMIDDFELRQNGPSYSYLTAEAMADQFPTARLFWIMGGDQWDALPRWSHPERLAACVEFIVLARGAPPESRDGYRLHIVSGQHPASATTIRQAISNGDSEILHLKPEVRDWIRTQNLYQQITL